MGGLHIIAELACFGGNLKKTAGFSNLYFLYFVVGEFQKKMLSPAKKNRKMCKSSKIIPNLHGEKNGFFQKKPVLFPKKSKKTAQKTLVNRHHGLKRFFTFAKNTTYT